MDIEKIVINEMLCLGEGARKILIEEIKKRNINKVLVVTDNSIYNAEANKKITDLLDVNEIKYIELNHTSTKNAIDGLEICKKEKTNFIINVGGNYSIAIKMFGIEEQDNPILTVIDTELVSTINKHTVAIVGIGVLKQAINGYIAKSKSIISQMFLMKAIQLIYDNLEKAVNENDQEAIKKVGIGQCIAEMESSDNEIGINHFMDRKNLSNELLNVAECDDEACYDEFREILTQAFHIDAILFTKEETIKSLHECIENLSYEVGITEID